MAVSRIAGAWAGPLTLGVGLLAWQLLADILQSTLLPGPWAVSATILEGLTEGELLFHVGVTLARVVAAFTLALFIGAAIGIALGLREGLNRVFDPWLILFLNLPALVIIILCYLWIGLGEVAAVLAVTINKIPNVAVTLREGARALDPGLERLSRLYAIRGTARFRWIILPQLAPYLAASARSGLALIWKIVLVVELLGRSNGVGFQLHLAFQLFDVTAILAYSFAFIAVIGLIEKGLMQPLERRANAWRASP